MSIPPLSRTSPSLKRFVEQEPSQLRGHRECLSIRELPLNLQQVLDEEEFSSIATRVILCAGTVLSQPPALQEEPLEVTFCLEDEKRVIISISDSDSDSSSSSGD